MTTNEEIIQHEKARFALTMKVRDYECDLQGVVNNANYQHYFEHARHEYLESLGDNFDKMHQEGYDAMVAKVIINYRQSLRSGDRFMVTINHRREGVRFIFEQQIYRLPDNALCADGEVHCIVVKDGKLTRGEYFDALMNP